MSDATVKRFEQAEELGLHIRNIVDLASELATDGLNQHDGPVEDLLQAMHDRTYCSEALCARYWSMHASLELDEEDGVDAEDLKQELHDRGVYGVALQMGLEVREYLEGGAGWTASRGYIETYWVYGETFDEAWADAVKWAERRVTEWEEGQ